MKKVVDEDSAASSVSSCISVEIESKENINGKSMKRKSGRVEIIKRKPNYNEISDDDDL